MPLRTHLDSPHRDGENWEVVLDQRNPQRTTTTVNPTLLAQNSLPRNVPLSLSLRRRREVQLGEQTRPCLLLAVGINERPQRGTAPAQLVIEPVGVPFRA